MKTAANRASWTQWSYRRPGRPAIEPISWCSWGGRRESNSGSSTPGPCGGWRRSTPCTRTFPPTAVQSDTLRTEAVQLEVKQSLQKILVTFVRQLESDLFASLCSRAPCPSSSGLVLGLEDVSSSLLWTGSSCSDLSLDHFWRRCGSCGWTLGWTVAHLQPPCRGSTPPELWWVPGGASPQVASSTARRTGLSPSHLSSFESFPLHPVGLQSWHGVTSDLHLWRSAPLGEVLFHSGA